MSEASAISELVGTALRFAFTLQTKCTMVCLEANQDHLSSKVSDRLGPESAGLYLHQLKRSSDFFGLVGTKQ